MFCSGAAKHVVQNVTHCYQASYKKYTGLGNKTQCEVLNSFGETARHLGLFVHRFLICDLKKNRKGQRNFPVRNTGEFLKQHHQFGLSNKIQVGFYHFGDLLFNTSFLSCWVPRYLMWLHYTEIAKT